MFCFKQHPYALLCVSLSFLAVPSIALSDGFVDSFDRNYLQLTTFDQRVREGSSSGITQADGRVTVTAVPPLGESGFTNFVLNENPNRFEVIGSLSEDSIVDEGGFVDYTINGRVFNTIQDDGVSSGSGEGDVHASVRVRMDDQRNVTAKYCIWRNNADDSLDFSFLGGSNCAPLSDVASVGEQFTMSLVVDSDSGSITYGFNDESITYTLTEPAFTTRFPYRRVAVDVRGDESIGIGYVDSLTTDSFSESFDTELVLSRYRTSSVGNFSVADGDLKIAVASDSSEEQNARVNINEKTDYVEATVKLSGESITIDDGNTRSRARVMLSGEMYNDISDGGTGNGREGDVFAHQVVQLREDGSVVNFFCLTRSNDDGFNDETALIVREDGGDCESHDVSIELDQDVVMSIQLDRTKNAVLYRLDDQFYEHSITSNVYTSENTTKAVRARTEGSATAIVYVSELATDASRAKQGNTEEMVPEVVQPEEMEPLTDSEIPAFYGAVYSSTAVEVFWESSTNGPFEVKRDGESVYVGDGRSFFDNSLSPLSAYEYKVSTANDESSLMLVTLTDYTVAAALPAAPSDLVGEAYSSTALEIFWSRVTSAPTATHYEVSRDGSVLISLDGLSHFDNRLEAGTSYTYSVVSVSEGGQRSDPSTVVVSTRAQ